MKDIDWDRVGRDLDDFGCAVLPALLDADQCAAYAAGYADDARFRSRVVMERHGFGRGEYRYYAYPLPPGLAALRTALYPLLARIANRWQAALGLPERYPDAHADYLARCHAAGQLRPTPFCCNTARATTTASTRTCTATSSSRCRWLCCCHAPASTSPAASSC